MTETTTEKYNIYKIASVSPKVEVGNPEQNLKNIEEELKRPELQDARIVVFPELCISGYTCGDLFFQQNLVKKSEEALIGLSRDLSSDQRIIAVGLPMLNNGMLYNCAAVIFKGKIAGIVPKTHIPNYQEFYEKRWFSSGKEIINEHIEICGTPVPFGVDLLFSLDKIKIGIEICEDLWVPAPPSSRLCMAGAEIILNLSATDDNIGKYDYIKSLVAAQSAKCRCAYAYSSAGDGESSTDLVFSGINLIGMDGAIVASSERFSPDSSFASAYVDVDKIRQDRRKYSTFYDDAGDKVKVINLGEIERKNSQYSHSNNELIVDPHPFIPEKQEEREKKCLEIINIQSWGLAQRLKVTGCKSLIVGISGGLDSTLALLIAHFTFKKLNLDLKGIKGVTMPSVATTSRTYNNALNLMKCLGVDILEIPIKEAVDLHFRDIGHDPENFNAVYENSQARERTQILMDLANKFNAMVLGTGDMSELALGWCTYNGDHISMYNVNAGVPKTLVKHIVRWFAETSISEELKTILLDILDTPISPELIPSGSENEITQITEDLVGPYELHDFFLFHVLRNGFGPKKIMFLARIAFADRYDVKTLKKWIINFYKRFFSQQFKRSCMPDGPKIGSVCLSPRGDWRMPSDASCKIWIREAEEISL